MNTTVMSEPELLEDTQLVSLCLAGDRDAFGQIVARYQSLVCALAYSACGDIARSEDLAQETFLAAWRQLRGLKEPAKLKSWLCGIVRNLINDSFRRQTRNPLTQAEALEEDRAGSSPSDTPPDHAISKEEEAILWRVLEGMPRSCREPMVLFYRQEESVAEVADALSVSEEAVRQRLSRGRAMLNERVAKFVESGLRQSAPGRAFTLGVLAALPVCAASASAATVGAAAGRKVLPAVGWIAVGDRAMGILFAFGGVAVGAVSIGGVSVGLLSVGGLSLGLLSLGGLALGAWAWGGAAIG